MWAAGGSGSTYVRSGSTYVLGYLDSHLSGSSRDNSDKLIDSEEEALDLVYNALCLAMDRDGSSGGFVWMYVIDQSGRRFVSRMPNGRNVNGFMILMLLQLLQVEIHKNECYLVIVHFHEEVNTLFYCNDLRIADGHHYCSWFLSKT
jgi:hypothetical protein